ncbi:hypothetical protein AB751O23_AK_00130 [Chlamydiales bacterium SCGC AB-751-O23]|nr:hypothetical protein AB751O23_AK_00130 [Chlamydiales bacterium SCGC AB-751-O23]
MFISNLTMKSALLLFAFTMLFSACTTGTMLRSPRTLKQGELEVSTGVVATEVLPGSVVIAAYGVTDRFEIEGRAEFDYIAVNPRFQILNAEEHNLDLTVSTEIGYGETHGFRTGPGIILGRRFKNIEPYLGYRYRSFSNGRVFTSSHVHYTMIGSSFYIPNSSFFLRAEGGAYVLGDSSLFQYGISFGTTF